MPWPNERAPFTAGAWNGFLQKSPSNTQDPENRACELVQARRFGAINAE